MQTSLPARIFAILSLAATVTVASDPELPALFSRAKLEFSTSRFKDSLDDLDKLDALSLTKGNESDRLQLEPVISFYRGANLAALGKKAEAKSAFVTYLSLSPAAQIDPKLYPKPIVEAFRAARQEAGAGLDHSLAADYASFHPAASDTPLPDERWGAGPVRQLLSRQELSQWNDLKTNEERVNFVDAFWKRLDPTPADPDNAIRAEFERRVLFAQKKFATEKKPGSESDRALVFALLGPPSYVGVARLSASDTQMDMMRGGTSNGTLSPNRASGGGSVGQAIGGSAASDGLMTDLQRGMREAWYYRKDRLPGAMRYSELRVDFVTREGQGYGVLQRDPNVLQALGQAAEIMISSR